jgi:hypothetical protein
MRARASWFKYRPAQPVEASEHWVSFQPVGVSAFKAKGHFLLGSAALVVHPLRVKARHGAAALPTPRLSALPDRHPGNQQGGDRVEPPPAEYMFPRQPSHAAMSDPTM